MIYSDNDITAFVKGELARGKSRQFQSDMAASAELADRVAEVRGALLPIKEAFDQEPIPSVPTHLKEFMAAQSSDAQAQKHSPPKLAIAACVAMALVVAGLLLNQFGPGERTLTTDASGAVGNTLHRDWVERVADYQSLYTQSTVGEPKPDAVKQAKALLGRISAKTSLKTALPDLSNHGYRFARAQELGFNGEALVQLVYSKPGTAPLAFCYMKSVDNVSIPVRQQPFHQLNAASWQSNGQQYVVVAAENPSTLASMSQSLKDYF